MVVAERIKIVYIPMLVLGVIGAGIAIFANNSLHLAVLVGVWVLSIVLLSVALWGLLSPTKAIEKKDDCLVINYLFRKKVISFDKIENVSMTERGEYYKRKNSATSDIVFFSDIRRLCINYKENDVICHSYVIVKNALAAKCSIDSLLKE